MFRFIALSWDASDAEADLAATAWVSALREGPEWRMALALSGFAVLVAGPVGPEPKTRPWLRGRGVIVGSLFGQSDPHATDAYLRPRTSDLEEPCAETACHALLMSCWGSYVAFVHGPTGGSTVFRDPTGALPCYLVQHRRVGIAFSWLEDVLSGPIHLPLPFVDWDKVASLMAYGELGDGSTSLQGVRKLLPGELAGFRGPTPSRLLWDAVELARRPLDIGIPEAASELKARVHRCVHAQAARHDRILMRLSGGLDSSILAACLGAQCTDTEVLCVHHHSDGPNEDERPQAREVARRAGLRLLECRRDDDFDLRSVVDVARTPTPEGHVGRMGTSRTDAALAAEHRAPAMFTGGGGDQLFFGFRQWWPAADHLRLHGPSRRFLSIAMEAARLGGVSFWVAVSRAVLDRLRVRDAWESYGQRPLLASPASQPAARQPRRHLHPALHGPTGLPIGKFMHVRVLMHVPDPYDPFERDRAPELVNPLLSQPVLELCLRLPTFVLAAGGVSRGLVRRAFAPDLPPDVAWRRAKGGIESYLDLVLRRNIGFARSMLLDGELVRHHIVERRVIEDALAGRSGTWRIPSGEIHTLIGIEAWARRFGGARGPC